MHAGNCAHTVANARLAAVAAALLHIGCHLPLGLQLGAVGTLPDDR